ncbi:MAG: trigger factor [Burkholderiales bacterium]|jgi:trigger factor|nr:trigger factor [Burkholderiales bacterium]
MSIEVLKGLERKVTFTIKKDDVKALVDGELKKYAKKAKIQGFRPGKAPRNVVEQMYGGQAYEDSLNNKINEKFGAIVTENKVDIVGYPKFDLTNSEGEEFAFAAVFEVMPEIKIGDLAAQSVVKPICNVTDETVLKTIETLCKQRATFTEEDKAAENGDKVTVDFVGTVDGVEFEGGKGTNYPFVLGQNMMLPDFEAGIIGLKAGQSKDVTVAFPENYHAENLKGKNAKFNISVKSVARQQLPELTEDFIKSLGVNDGKVETLTKEIKENLEREVNRRLRVKLRDNVLNALSTATPIDAPSAMVHDEIHRMMKSTEENMKKQGYPADKIKLTHEMFSQDAKRFVTLRMLVQEYIKENALKVSDDEVKATVTEMSTMYDEPEKYVNWYYQDKNRVNTAHAITMENKVIDSIISKVKIQEKEANYEELMREQI